MPTETREPIIVDEERDWPSPEESAQARAELEVVMRRRRQRTHDPRPEDPTELARKVAEELRKRGIWACASPWHFHPSEVAMPQIMPGDVLRWKRYSMHVSDFDNLGSVACADEIQRQESNRAREWAGDK